MSEYTILSSDIEHIRLLADAIRELERSFDSDIAGELEAISGSLSQMAALAQTPSNELRILHGTIMDFASISGIALAILSLKETLVTLKAPKVLAIVGVIGGISAALNILSSTFGDTENPTRTFTRSLRKSREAFAALRGETEQSQGAIRNTASALLTLNETQERSSAQNEIMRRKVAELNAAIPGLGLRYDELSGSINMSDDALMDFISRAENQQDHEQQIERLAYLYARLEEVCDDVRTSTNKLADATADWCDRGRLLHKEKPPVAKPPAGLITLPTTYFSFPRILLT